MRTLVLVHGRSQQGKDPAVLKQEWLGALHEGFTAAGLTLELPDDRVRFPYYGDTLDRLSAGDAGDVPAVVVQGDGGIDVEEKAFLSAAVLDAVETAEIPHDAIRHELGADHVEMGPQNWPWVLASIRALERVKGLGGPILAAVTRDVFHYLRRPGVSTPIDNGVRSALETAPGEGIRECVVVAHSLGTIVAYNVLRQRAPDATWTVPTLITLGCPLAVVPVIDALTPIGRPSFVQEWFNAYDEQDVVALHPLDRKHFGVTPPVDNYGEVKNDASNHHSIPGYLADPVVARRIYDALTR